MKFCRDPDTGSSRNKLRIERFVYVVILVVQCLLADWGEKNRLLSQTVHSSKLIMNLSLGNLSCRSDLNDER